VLRQDPDVIFVGEMRDVEAAKIAMRAALTGHLVFSSVHTRDAIGTVLRLEEMGIERYQISSALRAVVAQRLVRVVCQACREAHLSVGNELEAVGVLIPEQVEIYRAKGCDQCAGTGYIGRTGIFELLVIDDELRRAINEGTSQQSLLRLARGHGFQSFYEDGGYKVLTGVTTVEEVLHAS
jgi:general secretion pathway protein E